MLKTELEEENKELKKQLLTAQKELKIFKDLVMDSLKHLRETNCDDVIEPIEDFLVRTELPLKQTIKLEIPSYYNNNITFLEINHKQLENFKIIT